MTITAIDHTRRLVNDLAGLWSGSTVETTGLLTRGTKDMARKSFVIQKRLAFTFNPGQTYYALPPDHIDTFTMFRGVYSVVVRLFDEECHPWWLVTDIDGNARFVPSQPFGDVLFGNVEIHYLVIGQGTGQPAFTLRDPAGILWSFTALPTGELQGVITTTPVVPVVDALRFRDALGHVWHVTVGLTGELHVDSAQPAGTLSPIMATLFLEDSLSGVWALRVLPTQELHMFGNPVRYIFPSLTGRIVVSAIPPPNFCATPAFVALRDSGGTVWSLSVLGTGELQSVVPASPPTPVIDAIRFVDTLAGVWYVTVLLTGELSVSASVPSGVIQDAGTLLVLRDREDDLDIGWGIAVIPTQELQVDTNPGPPSVGSTETVQLRDPLGFPWYPAVDEDDHFFLTRNGTATLTAPVHADHAMQEIEPEAIPRIDPHAIPAAPERFAIMGGNILVVHPAPDQAYQVRMLFFSEDITLLPPACANEPPLFAAAMILERWHRQTEGQRYISMFRHAPSQEFLAIYHSEIALLEQSMSPSSRDGADFYAQPNKS